MSNEPETAVPVRGQFGQNIVALGDLYGFAEVATEKNRLYREPADDQRRDS